MIREKSKLAQLIDDLSFKKYWLVNPRKEI